MSCTSHPQPHIVQLLHTFGQSANVAKRAAHLINLPKCPAFGLLHYTTNQYMPLSVANIHCT